MLFCCFQQQLVFRFWYLIKIILLIITIILLAFAYTGCDFYSKLKSICQIMAW